MSKHRLYQYTPLCIALQEIRLVQLLPGEFADPINIRIIHAPLTPPPPPTSQESGKHIRLINSLQASVRTPWVIEETEDGEIMLYNVVTGETRPIPSLASSPEESAEGSPDYYEPRYEALSYTWGDAGVSEYARVKAGDIGQAEGSEEPSETTLGLRPNLASALRHLRYRNGTTRVLWIDALCINQADIGERDEQVKRMANVYALAHRVIAWLGEESSDSKEALATLRYVARQLNVTKTNRVIAAPDATEPRLWMNSRSPSFSQQTWQAIISFVERTWFYRLWCWQEINLGGRQAFLQCGGDSIPWNDFWLAILCLHNKDSSPSMRFRERCRHIAFLRYKAGGHSMTNILDISRSKGCADPRDKIYGLLGITPRSFSSGIEVNYLRTVEDVYKQAFLTHLGVTKRLELLKHCDLTSRQIGGPSWVPDWSRTEFRAPILSEQLSSGISRAWFTYTEPCLLEVAGTRYTTIKSIGGVASKAEEETLLAIRAWFQDLPKERTYILTGESMEAAFALTLCMNRTAERHPSNHFMWTPKWVGWLRQALRLTAASQTDPTYSARETANIVQKIRGRRFFTTEDGCIGTAPAGAQTGDLICLILGTYAPIVLRQTSPSSFQVVGECYVHGLSDCVGILGPLPDNWNVIIRGDASGQPTPWFVNTQNGETTKDDPRLEPLPQTWKRATYDRVADDPLIFERFENAETGDVVNYDPRLSPEALRARGVALQSFRLV